MQVKVEEIQEDIFQVTLRPPGSIVTFSHFVIRDEVPALIHTGHQKTFDIVYKQTSKILDPKTIKYITFSHFEPDECGSLNQWLSAVPSARIFLTKICDWSVRDSAIRAANVVKDGHVLNLGKHQLKILETPHFPHAWEACLFYDSYTKVLFSSDIGTQKGSSVLTDVSDPVEEIVDLQLKLGYTSFGKAMALGLEKLEKLDISRLATMHGAPLNKKNTRKLFELLKLKNLEVCQELIETNATGSKSESSCAK